MKLVSILAFLLVVSPGSVAAADTYQEAMSEWNTYKDVADWLKSNFSFQKSRQKQISKRLRSVGPSGLLVRRPEAFFSDSNGYCADSANFAISTLNAIDPSYNARWVFIKNDAGRPNHWVAAFDHEGGIYVMDFGTGSKWQAMQGVHGPYDSLDEYREFLATLDLPRFEVGDVYYREMPGKED